MYSKALLPISVPRDDNTPDMEKGMHYSISKQLTDNRRQTTDDARQVMPCDLK
jgi:hypothetical protein